MGELQILKAFTPGAAGIWLLVAMCAMTLIKGWPALKRIGLEADASLRADLLERIGDLEAALAQERRDCDRQIEELRKEVSGLQRQLIAFQLASGQPLPLDTPETDRAIARLREALDKKEI